MKHIAKIKSDGTSVGTKVFFVDEHGSEFEVTEAVRKIEWSIVPGEFAQAKIEMIAEVEVLGEATTSVVELNGMEIKEEQDGK